MEQEAAEYQASRISTDDVEAPDINHLITEDDTPVDNMYSEKQQRLLSNALYASWPVGRPFIAATNVAIYRAVKQPPVVPDLFVSLDTQPAPNWHEKRHRSYMLWEFGKPPEVAVEIVSNREGGETGHKLREYCQIGVAYYVIYDPGLLIQDEKVTVYGLQFGVYVPYNDMFLRNIGLGLTLWSGKFENTSDEWLRWCDLDGNLLLTGEELAIQEKKLARKERVRAEKEKARAEKESARAEEEKTRANNEKSRSERLAAQLRAAGIVPEA